MTMLTVGIDVGLSGAIAVIDANGLRDVYDMPVAQKGRATGKVKNEVNAAALWVLLGALGVEAAEIVVAIEDTQAMPSAAPGEERRTMGAAGAMSIGDSRGAVRAIVAARGFPVEWVTASRWKRYFALGRDKEQARAKAIQLYPQADLHRKKDHNRAEAILIARYAWEIFR